MRSKIAQEILDEMEPKHSDLVREYGALWLENDQQAIQIKALKEQLQAAVNSLKNYKALVEEIHALREHHLKYDNECYVCCLDDLLKIVNK